MCGLVFSEGPALRRHLRNEHPGAGKCLIIRGAKYMLITHYDIVVNPNRGAKTQAEIIAGQNAIRRWVLQGGLRCPYQFPRG